MRKGTLEVTERTGFQDRPMAAAGLKSYRCKGRYGWIMIGALDADDALREARRSYSGAKREDLEAWDGERYINVDTGTVAA